MARKEELEIEIAADGQVRVHGSGIKGPACTDYVEVFRRLLGPVADQQATPEYYEVETGTLTSHQVGRSRLV